MGDNPDSQYLIEYVAGNGHARYTSMRPLGYTFITHFFDVVPPGKTLYELNLNLVFVTLLLQSPPKSYSLAMLYRREYAPG